MDETGSELCPTASSGISNVEPSGSSVKLQMVLTVNYMLCHMILYSYGT